MLLKPNAFDIPARPRRMSHWSLVQLLGHVMALGMFGYLSGTWLSLLLIGYVLGLEAIVAVREWRWHRYADRVEGAFVTIGKASSELAEALQKIAEAAEALAVNPAPQPAPETPQPNATPGGVLYWAADSKGKN
jgi:hypothetical protein